MSTIKAINIQHPSSANTNIVMDANGNMTVAGTVSGGTPMSGMRNRLINGAFDIWQRGTTFSGSAAGSYQADRWVKMTGGVTGSNTTVSQITSTGLTGFYSALRYQRNSGTTNTGSMYIGQIIESLNMRDLAGQTVTLSFYARAGANYSVASNALTSLVAFGTTADEGFAGFNAGTWAGYTQTPQTITLTSSWQRFSQTVTVPSNTLEMGMYFYGQTTGTAGAADYYDVTGVQLELGTVATPFERRMYGHELQLCQRYFHTTLNESSKVGFTGVGYGNYSIYGGVHAFPTTMRVAPTMTIYRYGHGADQTAFGDGTVGRFSAYSSGSANQTPTSTYGAALIATTKGIVMGNLGDNTTASPVTVYMCGYTASAEL